MNECRVEFEQHALDRSLFITRRADGDYDEGYTRIAWEYFKAGWEAKMTHKDAPPRTGEQERFETFWAAKLKERNAPCGFSRDKQGAYHAEFARDGWDAWQCAITPTARITQGSRVKLSRPKPQDDPFKQGSILGLDAEGRLLVNWDKGNGGIPYYLSELRLAE